jgi:hypothetical protein
MGHLILMVVIHQLIRYVGLNLKFIPTSWVISDDLEPTFERLERDVHFKVYFACDDESAEIYKDHFQGGTS